MYSDAPQHLIKRLQKVQTAAAGYVTSHFATSQDLVKLNWLPIQERIDWTIAKMTHNSLYNEQWPTYLKSSFVQPKRQLRATRERENVIESSYVHGSFNYLACQVFNNLPGPCRSSKSYVEFARLSKSYLFDKAVAKIEQNH